jgi:hypothetical protein
MMHHQPDMTPAGNGCIYTNQPVSQPASNIQKYIMTFMDGLAHHCLWMMDTLAGHVGLAILHSL